MTDRELAQMLYLALKEATEHLEYCGYGDSWERQCAYSEKLPEKLEAAIEAAEKEGLEIPVQ